MKAGELDRRLTIEQYTEAQDAYGEPIKWWSVLETVWAQISPVRGTERYVARQVSGEAETRFRIRWRSDVTDKMRLYCENVYYNITAVLEIGRHEGLEIMARAFMPADVSILPASGGRTYFDAVMGLGPRAYWRMGEASGDLADSSGNGNTAADHGTPTYGVAGAIVGDPDTAVSLAGLEPDRFEAPNSASLDTADVFTIIAWIKKALNGVDMEILSRPGNSYEFMMFATNKLMLRKNWTLQIVESTITITDTNWHMVVVAKDGAASCRLYIDRVDVTGTVSDQTIVANHGITQIGRNALIADGGGGSTPWKGSLDEIAVFATALNAAQIAHLYVLAKQAWL